METDKNNPGAAVPGTTHTGRLVSDTPNLQNIVRHTELGRQILPAFVPNVFSSEATPTEVTFSDVVEDAIGCFVMALVEIPEFAAWWDTRTKDPALLAKINACMEGAKQQVTDDCAGFKIVKS
jgi:hypothetical protein